MSAAADLAFIHGYHRGKSPAERLQVVKLFVELGNDVNWPDDYGITPLMPIDYAIGVGTFVPNNAVIIHEDAVALMAKFMKERRIAHTTSECTLRGFTRSQARVDPKVATPGEIMRARRMAIGHQVEGLTGGLEAK